MDPDQKKTAAMARQFISAIPHAKALGMTLTEIGAGRAVMQMPYRKELVGDPDRGVIHGGAVFALVDTCGGASVMCHPACPAATATIDLRIDYMRGATPGQTIEARATCYHVTRTVAFVRVVAVDDDDENPIATATGAFSIEQRKRTSQ